MAKRPAYPNHVGTIGGTVRMAMDYGSIAITGNACTGLVLTLLCWLLNTPHA